MTLLFDTLKLSKTLREKGHFSPEQADAIAEGLSSASVGNLATKVSTSLRTASILVVKTASSLARSKWLVGSVGVQTIVIIGAIITLVRMFGKTG